MNLDHWLAFLRHPAIPTSRCGLHRMNDRDEIWITRYYTPGKPKGRIVQHYQDGILVRSAFIPA